MSTAKEKGKGIVEEIGGKAKETVGAIVGNEKLETKGQVEKLKGQARQEAAEVAEQVKDKVEAIKDAAEKK